MAIRVLQLFMTRMIRAAKQVNDDNGTSGDAHNDDDDMSGEVRKDDGDAVAAARSDEDDTSGE